MKRIVIVASLCLAGCIGPNPELGVVNLPETAPKATFGVALADVVPPGAKSVTEIAATSCRNKVWDPSPTEENALAQLRVKAASLGASGIAEVTYDSGSTDLIKNCWSSITARAKAFTR